jgi:hypothetical protein
VPRSWPYQASLANAPSHKSDGPNDERAIMGGIGLQAIYRWERRAPSGHWDSSSLAFTMPSGSCGAPTLHRFRASPTFRTGYASPSAFRLRVSAVTHEASLEPHSRLPRLTGMRLTAQIVPPRLHRSVPVGRAPWLAVSSCCPVCTLVIALTMTTPHSCPRSDPRSPTMWPDGGSPCG